MESKKPRQSFKNVKTKKLFKIRIINIQIVIWTSGSIAERCLIIFRKRQHNASLISKQRCIGCTNWIHKNRQNSNECIVQKIMENVIFKHSDMTTNYVCCHNGCFDLKTRGFHYKSSKAGPVYQKFVQLNQFFDSIMRQCSTESG